MRANTSALHAFPGLSIIEATQEGNNRYFNSFSKGAKWAKFVFPSVRACHEFARKHARTDNERWGLQSGNASWNGLGEQSIADFDATGVATHPRDLLLAASAKLPERRTRLAEPRAAVTGGFWDTPSVLANLPLSARTRHRTKLTPKTIRIAMSFSASVNPEHMAVQVARIAHAVRAYTLAGGAVDIRVAYMGGARQSSLGCVGSVWESHVNASDLAELSLGLSVAMFRAVCGPLMTAFSESSSDGISVPSICPIAGYASIAGPSGDSLRAIDAIIKSLELT